MKHRATGLIYTLLLLAPTPTLADDWPAWRGRSQDGTTPETALPTTWSPSDNLTWKTPLPGPGNSTPIISGDRIFLTAASDKGAVRSVLCFDRATGKPLWRQDVKFSGQETTHETSPYCSASPVTDGRRVFAWHGSAGVVAYTVDGKPLWHRDLGPFHHIWGNAASPVLHRNNVILNLGPGPESRLIALNADTGETAWETDLPEAKGKPDQFKGSWSTPIIFTRDVGDGWTTTLIVLSLPGYLAAFDAAKGTEVWRCHGLGDLVYTSPVIGKDVIVAMSGYQGPALAMRIPKFAERGDLTESHRLWVEEKPQQRVGSGVIAGEHFYLVNDPGVAQCIELKTGKTVWRQRASANNWSSAVLSGDRIYSIDQSGETVVFRATPDKLEILAQNALEETTRASPVVSDGQIFLRTYKHLYCIGERKQSNPRK